MTQDKRSDGSVREFRNHYSIIAIDKKVGHPLKMKMGRPKNFGMWIAETGLEESLSKDGIRFTIEPE
jgi:hypothetical protein